MTKLYNLNNIYYNNMPSIGNNKLFIAKIENLQSGIKIDNLKIEEQWNILQIDNYMEVKTNYISFAFDLANFDLENFDLENIVDTGALHLPGFDGSLDNVMDDKILNSENLYQLSNADFYYLYQQEKMNALNTIHETCNSLTKFDYTSDLWGHAMNLSTQFASSFELKLGVTKHFGMNVPYKPAGAGMSDIKETSIVAGDKFLNCDSALFYTNDRLEALRLACEGHKDFGMFHKYKDVVVEYKGNFHKFSMDELDAYNNCINNFIWPQDLNIITDIAGPFENIVQQIGVIIRAAQDLDAHLVNKMLQYDTHTSWLSNADQLNWLLDPMTYKLPTVFAEVNQLLNAELIRGIYLLNQRGVDVFLTFLKQNPDHFSRFAKVLCEKQAIVDAMMPALTAFLGG